MPRESLGVIMGFGFLTTACILFGVAWGWQAGVAMACYAVGTELLKR